MSEKVPAGGTLRSEALDRAVRDGVVTPEQAEALGGYAAGVQSQPAHRDESLRFLTSFNDVFLTIGLFVLLSGAAALASVVLSPMLIASPDLWTISVSLCVAALSWALAEYFCARRRLLLPSMLLATAISVALGIAAATLMVKLTTDSAKTDLMNAVAGADAGRAVGDWVKGKLFGVNYAAVFATALAALFVHLRYRLAYALFLVASFGALGFYLFLFNHGWIGGLGGFALLIAGLVTLGAAMAFDASDPERRTVRSDNGFWLHVAAAPQIVLGLRELILGGGGTGESAMMLAVIVLLAALSLALDRRALIVSALLTFLYAVTTLARAGGLSGGYLSAVPLLVAGGGVVLLGAGWDTARARLLAVLPRGGLWGRLFPSEPVQKGPASAA